MDSRISPISGVTLTQNNGLTIGVSQRITTFYILTSSSATSPFIMEAYETYYGTSTTNNSNLQWGLVIDSSTSTSQNTGGGGGGTNYMARILNVGTGPQLITGSTLLSSGNSYFAYKYTAIDSFIQTPSGITAKFNGISQSTSTTTLTSGYIGFYTYSNNANVNVATVQWLRTRAYPPNGVMPSVKISPIIATPLETLAGITSGTITYSMPIIEENYKKFIAYVNGYENDTTTNQTIIFPVDFINPPVVTINTSSLSITYNNTSLTINAPNNGVVYNGWIIIEGY